ncbi:hypothetical protein ABVF61_05220 [Roseibium sp. HPY-6]|uniref:hypothetical protein n=1 Tax=Roseibium sp. HPY-6 TaxID=3229852 RepID=UPI00338F435D
MTVSILTNTRAQILGDGVTDRIDLNFQFVDENDLRVIHTDTGGTDTEWSFQQSPGNWSFTGGNFSPGTVYFSAADLQTGERLTVILTSRYGQPLSLDGGEIDPAVLERGMDRTTLQVQSIAGEVNRSLRISPSLAGSLPDLEVPDLPDGYGFVRSGDKLVPVLIDGEQITAYTASALAARDAAQVAEANAEAAEDKAETAQAAAETAQAAAEAAAGTLTDAYVSATQNTIVNSDTQWNDGLRARFGDAGNMNLFHDGFNSYLDHRDTGGLLFRNLLNGANTGFIGTNSSGVQQNCIVIQDGQYVRAFFGGGERLRTINTGIEIRGIDNQIAGFFGKDANNDTFVSLRDHTNGVSRPILWDDSAGKMRVMDVNNIFHDMLSVGQNQVWQNMTVDRMTGVAYQNTSGRPIQLYLTLTGSGSQISTALHSFQVSEDGLVWSPVFRCSGGINGGGGFAIVIPSGHYYRLNTGTAIVWQELR